MLQFPKPLQYLGKIALFSLFLYLFNLQPGHTLPNPTDPSGLTIYPSGVLDSDFGFSLPKSKDIILSLGADVWNPFTKHLIQKGFYYIKASIEDTDIYLTLYKPDKRFQPVKLPISNYIIQEKNLSEPVPYTQLKNFGNTLEIGLKFGKYTIYRDLEIK